MMNRLRDESGVAMVIALLAMMVIGTLAVAGFQYSTHNLDQSANDRRRVQAIHAAEAGIDKFVNYLATAPITGTACSFPAETLTTSPPSQFTVTATYYPDVLGSPAMACPPSSVPGGVLIHSVGTAAGVSRTMEAWYGINAVAGGTALFNGAIYSDGQVSISGQATLSGSPYGADLYSNGDLTLGGGGTVFGNVQVQGMLTLKGGSDIKQDATSKLHLDMSGGSAVRGNARSSTADISTSNNSTIYGNAYYCTGSAPGGVVGSKTQNCNSSLPASQPWSSYTFTFTPSNWTGYTIQTFNDPLACTAAQTFISTIASGNYVIRINSTCTLSYGSHDTIPVKGNLAIISNGSLSMNSQAAFTTTATHNLFLMFNIATARPCVTSGIRFNSQANVSAQLNALLYTPCAITFGAQSAALTGQIIGGSVSFGAGASITTVPVLIPGPNPNGFQQSMVYRREII